MDLICENILEVFGLDWKSMLFYLGNLILLILVLVFVLYKPIKKMIKAKREALDSTFAENERLKKESETLQADYDKKLEAMKTESDRIAAEVAQTAESRAEAIVAEAQEQAHAIVDAAKKDAQFQRDQLKNEYRDSVNTLAVQIAQKLLEREVSDKDNDALIEQVLSDWEDGE